MIELILTIIKYTVILLCCLYSYAKLCAIRLKIRDILFIPLFAAISIGLYYVSVYVNLIIPVCLLLISAVIFGIRFRRTVFETVTLSIIALGMTIFLMVISTLGGILVGLLLIPIKNSAAYDIIDQASINILLIIFNVLLFRIKRFRNGIILYRKDSTFERLILASVICIFGLTLFYTNSAKLISVRMFIFVMIAFCGFSFIIWWKKLASANYDSQLQKHNVEVLYKTLTETEKDRDKLFKHNEELSKIIHRDNKLLTAMEYAVNDICKKYCTGSDASEVLESLQKLQSERVAAIESYENADNYQKTSNITVDATFAFLRKKAQIQHVEFALDINNEAADRFMEKFSDITSFNTLICDLGENAIIAAGRENGKVKIEICFKAEAPCIKFFDNGNPFAEKVFAEMGRTKITTRKNEGGSGIGLISTFEILRGYGFSLLINEIVPDDNFTKCVEIIADGKCVHRVFTKRESVKRICAEREDFLKTD